MRLIQTGVIRDSRLRLYMFASIRIYLYFYHYVVYSAYYILNVLVFDRKNNEMVLALTKGAFDADIKVMSAAVT